jgi:probable F420-dependent oxidoreductase
VHPFRFGVQQSSASSAEEWTSVARRAESLGYSILVMPDHLNNQLSPLAALAAVAGATTRIHLGAFVVANDYRHPLVLAREAATLDFLSNGRFELGMGAGWMVSDYRALGMPYDPPARRVDRLEESVVVVKRLLTGETLTFDGLHYHLDRATAGVAPVQRPRLPLAIGAGGPRMLRLAAREADIVGLLPGFSERGWPNMTQASETATAAKVAIVREAAGDRFEQLELNVWVHSAGIAGRGNSLIGSAVAAAGGAATAVYSSPYVIWGTLGAVRERLLRRRDALGISYYTIPARSMESMAPLVDALAGK